MKRILLPVNQDENLTGLVDRTTKIGWINVSDSTNLQTISQKLEETNTAVVDHAIPSPVAHIQHYTTKILGAKKYTEELNEWFGIIAILALRDIYRFNVTFENLPLNMTSFIGKIINDELKIDKNFNDQAIQNNVNNLQVVKFNGTPIAILHKSIFICPFKNYDTKTFADVQWYTVDKDNKPVWKDLKEVLQSNQTRLLSGVLTKLYEWLNWQCNNPPTDPNIASRFDILKEHLMDGIEDYTKITDIALIDDVKARGIIPNTFIDLLKMCKVQNRFPDLWFSDKVLLVDRKVDEENDEKIITEYNETVKNTNLTIFPSISDDIAKIYNIDNIDNIYNTDEISFEKIEYKINQPAEIIESIECIVFLEQGGVKIFKSKVFGFNDIVYMQSIPYISLWPNVDLPDNIWKLYYLNIKIKDINLPEPNCVYGMHSLKHNEVKYSVYDKYNNNISPNTVNSVIDRNEEWDIFKSETRVKFISFKFNMDNCDYTLGQIIIGKHNIPDSSKCSKFNLQTTIGVDFGATSTNCHMKVGSDAITIPVNTGAEYLLNISPSDENKIASFRNNCWVSNNNGIGESGKFFTAGQLFYDEGLDGKQDPYINGKTIYLDLDLLSSFIKAKLKEPLSSYGIYDNLKFQDQAAIGAGKKKKAILSLLKNLMIIATLKARLMGASSFVVNVSYAFSSAFDSLRDTWNTSLLDYITYINGLEKNVGVKVNCFTEAYAAGQYYVGLGAGKPVANDGYVIIDIGGGTTDISLWQGLAQDTDGNPIPKRHALKSNASIKYAGGKLVVRSIFQAMRKRNVFGTIWEKDKANTKIQSLIEEFDIIANEFGSQVSYNDSKYYTIQSIIDVLIEKAEINYQALSRPDDFAIALLTSLIKIKYFSLFYTISAYIKAKIDSGVFVPTGITKLFLAGCGAKGLDICIQSKYMSTFATSGFGIAVKNMIQDITGIKVEIIPPLTQNKEEVVFGLVNIGEGTDDKVPLEENSTADAINSNKSKFKDSYIDFYKRLNDNKNLFTIPKTNEFTNLVQLLSLNHPSIENNYELYNGFVLEMLDDNNSVTSINPQKDIINECFVTLMIDTLLEHNITQLNERSIVNEL
jgi:hypothetical protein